MYCPVFARPWQQARPAGETTNEGLHGKQLVWELIPEAYSNLPSASPGPSEFATMFYFSLATLTTTGYGDIVPLYPFARSLASLEAVIGPFYLTITVARLVTLWLRMA